MILRYVLGPNINAVVVIALLELLLAAHSIALFFNAQHKILKIVYIVMVVLWIVLAILNLIQ